MFGSKSNGKGSSSLISWRMAESIVEVLSSRSGASTSFEEFGYFKNLPDDITLLILSLLPLKDAVRTSALSTRWKDMWKIIPVVNLSSSDIGISGSYTNSCYDIHFEILDIILHIFKQRCDKVDIFADLVGGCHYVSHTLSVHSEDNSVLFMIGPSADRHISSCYLMWKELISAMVCLGEVLVMKYNFFMCPTLDHARCINHLLLQNVELTNYHLDMLLGRCSILQSLKISMCKGAVELRINHLFLTHVCIEYCASIKTIEISCSNLRSFLYVGEAILIRFKDVPHLETITYVLQGQPIPVYSFFNSLYESFDKLPAVLSHINVKFSRGIERNLLHSPSSCFNSLRGLMICLPETHKDLLWLIYLLEAAPYLQNLIVIQLDPFSQYVASEEAPEIISKPLLATCPHSYLESLEIDGFSGHTTEIELILCILKCAEHLLHIQVKSALGSSVSSDTAPFYQDIEPEGPDEIETAKATLLKAERARERALRYLQHEIPSRIVFTIA